MQKPTGQNVNIKAWLIIKALVVLLLILVTTCFSYMLRCIISEKHHFLLQCWLFDFKAAYVENSRFDIVKGF